MSKKDIGNAASDDDTQQARVAQEQGDEQKLREQVQQALIKRLKHAGKIISDLRSTPRVKKEDRPILARNLGYMYESEAKQNPNIGELKLFRAAFGDDGGESRHKKRKRYMRYASDKKNRADADIYAANGNDYVNLAIELTKLSLSTASSAEDDEKLAILRLVEGTEFDDRMGMVERSELTLRKEFQSVLDGVIDKVTGTVDLDAMSDWLQDNPVETEGEVGKLEAIKYGRGDTLLSYFKNLIVYQEANEPFVSNMAPSVRIGTIKSPYIPDGMMQIAYPKSSDSPYKGNDFPDSFMLSMSLQDKLGIIQDENNWDCLELDEGLQAPLSEHKDWIYSWEFGDKWETKKNPVAWINLAVDLELRHSFDTKRWTACLLIRPYGSLYYSPYHLDEGGALAAPQSTRRKPTIYQLGTDHDGSYIYASLIGETENDWIFAVFTDRNYVCEPEDKDNVYDITAGACRSFPSDSAYKMVFQSLVRYGHEFIAKIKDFKGFSPARSDSIAGLILRNLAYAADEDKIGNLLLADARHKAELVDALKNESKDEYLRGMKQAGYLKP